MYAARSPAATTKVFTTTTGVDRPEARQALARVVGSKSQGNNGGLRKTG
jgi:hypothetical protein